MAFDLGRRECGEYIVGLYADEKDFLPTVEEVQAVLAQLIEEEAIETGSLLFRHELPCHEELALKLDENGGDENLWYTSVDDEGNPCGFLSARYGKNPVIDNREGWEVRSENEPSEYIYLLDYWCMTSKYRSNHGSFFMLKRILECVHQILWPGLPTHRFPTNGAAEPFHMFGGIGIYALDDSNAARVLDLMGFEKLCRYKGSEELDIYYWEFRFTPLIG